MRPTILFICIVTGFTACQPSPPSPDPAKSDIPVEKATIVFPFTPKYPTRFQPGDEKNALIVLNALKHYVDGDMKGTMADFADSVEFYGDKFHFKGTKDSLAKIIGEERAQLTAVSKVMDTWATLYYPDNQDTWVTLWYTETWTDKKGKTDSTYFTDDVLIKKGKIVEYDEKHRDFPPLTTKK